MPQERTASASVARKLDDCAILRTLEQSLSKDQTGFGLTALINFYDGAAARDRLPPLFPPDLPPIGIPRDQNPALLPDVTALGQADHVEATPGSVFEWLPVEDSPGHGLWLVDALVRRLLGKEGRVLDKGFLLTNAKPQEEPGIFFYGEKHTDPELVRENLRRLGQDLRPGRRALILDEDYFGPRLFGAQALDYLLERGLPPELLPEGASLELRGWDDQEVYKQALHPTLQHHMNLYDLDRYLYGPERGLRYYRGLAQRLYATWRNWREMRRLSIEERNVQLDQSVRLALRDAAAQRRSVHVIAGTEHLLERPLLAGLPLIGRPCLREGLRKAAAGTRYRAFKPRSS